MKRDRSLAPLATFLWIAACSNAGQVTPGAASSIAKLCAEAIELPCRHTESQATCETMLQEKRGAALEQQCGTEYDQWLSCAAGRPLACVPGEDEPVFDPSCAGLRSSLDSCTAATRDAAGGTGGGGGTGGADAETDAGTDAGLD